MKKINLYLLGILLIPLSSFAQQKSNADSFKKLNQTVLELNNQVAQNKNQLENLKSLIQISNGTVANQLSSSQNNLSSLSTIFTVIGIILAIIALAIPFIAIYITRIANKVSKNIIEANAILDTIKTLKDDVSTMQKSVYDTQSLIQNNLSGLYQSLQDEEVKSLFQRLEIEPQDMRHFFARLTTVKFSKNYFDNLRNVYLKVKDIDTQCTDTAMTLLVQHYPSETLNDNILIKALPSYYISRGLYLAELPTYHLALCDFIRDKDISDHISLFTNEIFSIETIEKKPKMVAEKILKIWNNNLNADHKLYLINKIKEGSFKKFKSEFPNWNSVLNI